jgi:hypothetical protein
MSKAVDKLQAVDEFLKNGAWFLEFGGDKRVRGMTLKIEPTGYLLVLKVATPEGPQVAFYGCETLEKLYRFLQNGTENGSLKFREDRYF